MLALLRSGVGREARGEDRERVGERGGGCTWVVEVGLVAA